MIANLALLAGLLLSGFVAMVLFGAVFAARAATGGSMMQRLVLQLSPIGWWITALAAAEAGFVLWASQSGWLV